MAIRHREVFPVGSAPDSISWEQWNDDHVGGGGADQITESGGPTVLDIGAIADGEFLKRDGDEIVGAAGGGGLLSVTTHLLPADILTLFSDPPIVVPAPGAGKVLIPQSAIIQFVPGVGRYSNIGLPTISFVPNDIGSPYGLSGLDGGATLQLTSAITLLMQGDAPNSPPSTPTLVGDVENMPLYLYNDQGNDATWVAPIATSHIDAAGAGYAPGDTGTIDSAFPVGATLAEYVVDTVDGGGAVLTYHIVNHNACYDDLPGANATNVVTGGGDGNLTIKIDTITPALANADGDMYVTVYYTEETLH